MRSGWLRAATGLLALAGALGSSCGRGDPPATTPKQAASARDAGNAKLREPSQPTVPVSVEAQAGDAGPTRPNTASLDTKESRKVKRTLAKVSKLRGLEAKLPVPGETLERRALAARVKDKALREYPAEALKREGRVLELLGFAPHNFDYLGAVVELLEAQLAGFYEPNNGTMYLASDLDDGDAKATLAHELVHALQDQAWDLRSRSVYRPGRSDETLALACVAEGDATSLMLDYVMAPGKTALDMPDEVLRATMEGGIAFKTAHEVPHVLKRSLVAPYLEGVAFVHARRREGGWKAVDSAWERLPTTTEQILHPEKWQSGEPALVVPVPSGKALGEGFSRVDEDTTGELGLGLDFAEWLRVDDARTAASGWGGDRSAVWTKGDTVAYAVHVRYDEATGDKTKGERYARRAMGLLRHGVREIVGAPKTNTDDALCFERADTGPLFFGRTGGDLVLIAGPATASPGGWSSRSTCVDAKAWADEIHAQR